MSEGVTDPCAIVCSNCGAEHHIDAEGGHCRECSAFLPDATPEQHRLFTKRLEQTIRHEQGEVTVGGYTPGVHGPEYDTDR